MERLWTPWRLEYILSDKQPGCIFCAALAQRDDRETFIVYRGARAFVMLNKYPYNNGHLMVVPYQHSADLNALGVETQAELMHLIARALEWLRAASRPEGFNIGMNLGKAGGAGVVEHLHFHIVPRWAGDTNFMTITGETRVIVELLDDTWTRLRGVIEREERAT
jgi:ATP adenylyltransferase